MLDAPSRQSTTALEEWIVRIEKQVKTRILMYYNFEDCVDLHMYEQTSRLKCIYGQGN